jgi:hypothetical protein
VTAVGAGVDDDVNQRPHRENGNTSHQEGSIAVGGGGASGASRAASRAESEGRGNGNDENHDTDTDDDDEEGEEEGEDDEDDEDDEDEEEDDDDDEVEADSSLFDQFDEDHDHADAYVDHNEYMRLYERQRRGTGAGASTFMGGVCTFLVWQIRNFGQVSKLQKMERSMHMGTILRLRSKVGGGAVN